MATKHITTVQRTITSNNGSTTYASESNYIGRTTNSFGNYVARTTFVGSTGGGTSGSTGIEG
jgi:hypothetical protein